MTLEEAILHAEEVASDYEGMIEDYWLDSEKLAKCANEQRQIAEWLKELAERRKLPEIIRCKDCVDWGTNDCAMSQTVDFDPDYDWTNSDGYCHMAERRTDG